MKKYGYYILFYDNNESELISIEEVCVQLNSIPDVVSIEIAYLMAEQYGDERLQYLDAGVYVIHENDGTDITQVIVSHLDLCNFAPGWGTLQEIVIEYLTGWTCEPVSYIRDRYLMSELQTEALVEELEKFSKWRDK